jgi:hypothetical protein
MFLFDPLKLLVIILVSSLIPGAAIAIPFFKKAKLGVFEKLVFAFILGIVLPALLLLLEALVGVYFSLPLVLLNIFIITAVGLLWGVAENAFSFKMPSFKGELTFESLKGTIAPIALFILMFLAFWVRFQSYGPIYQELDPYFYLYGTSQILTAGVVPVTDDTAWYPVTVQTHRVAPLLMYLEAQWYALYTQGGEYSNYLLSAISSPYPPIVAALLTFGLYLIITEEYGRKYGLIAAGLIAFLPSSIMKMAAGVSEIQPYGFFALFFFFSSYAIAVKRNDFRFAALAGLAYMTVTLGSAVGVVVNMVLIGYILLQSISLLLRNKEMKNFFIINGIVLAGVLLSSILMTLYRASSLLSILSTPLLGVLGALLISILLWAIKTRIKDKEMKAYTVIGLIFLSALLLAFTPIGSKLQSYVGDAVGMAVFREPLQRTIAEQGAAGTSFEGELGFIGLKLDGLVGELFGPMTAVVNFFMQGIVDPILNLFFNLGLQTTAKDNSLLTVFLFITGLSLIFAFIRTALSRKNPSFESSELFLLFAVMAFPIAYVGLNKLKYTVFLGLAIVVAVSFSFGEIGKFIGNLAGYLSKDEEKKKKTISIATWLLFFIAILVVAGEAFGPPIGLGKALIVTSITPRFQDNPIALKDKLSTLCNTTNDPDVCAAGKDPINYSKDINSQFNSKLCYVSVINNISKSTTDEQLALSFKCSRIDDYWIESMEWIKNNVGEGDRVTSWWDYGHWINYFGEKKTVLRNEHASLEMIGEVAHGYIDGTPDELIAAMKRYDSKYALFDEELILNSGGQFGGKYGALNYLSCARDNETDVTQAPGTSECESEHMYETIYIPTEKEECTISQTQGINGTVGYTITRETGPDGTKQVLKPTYCVGETKLATGQTIQATYYIDRTDDEGNLKLNKAFLQKQYSLKDYDVYGALYTRDQIWIENGELVSGWEDRKGKFYGSNLYNAFFLKELPGFELVFESKNGEVKIYTLTG